MGTGEKQNNEIVPHPHPTHTPPTHHTPTHTHVHAQHATLHNDSLEYWYLKKEYESLLGRENAKEQFGRLQYLFLGEE